MGSGRPNSCEQHSVFCSSASNKKYTIQIEQSGFSVFTKYYKRWFSVEKGVQQSIAKDWK